MEIVNVLFFRVKAQAILRRFSVKYAQFSIINKERFILRKAVKALVCVVFAACSGCAYASTASNTGITGLWEYPTAEIPDDGNGRFGYTHDSPYSFVFIDVAWLPWLEINTRLTTFSTILINNDPEYRRYMDKAMDIKAMLWHSKNPEYWFIPSIAAGVADIMGTELMKAYYGVATWRWGDFALTAGYGNKRLNGFFAGFEWDVANWLTLKAEYSPLDYSNDSASGKKVLTEGPSKKYNAGVVLKAPWGMEGAVSYQRGDEWAFSVSQRINLRGPFIGASRKHFDAPGDMRIASWEGVDTEELLSRLKSGFEKYTRVRDVDLKLEETDEGHKISVAYENYGYSSHAEAMTRVLLVLSAVMPEMSEVVLIQKNAGVPIVQAVFPGTLLFDIRAHTLREDDAVQGSVFSWASAELEEADAEHLLKSKAQNEVKAMVVYEPRIDQTLKEEYMDRWSLDLIYNGRYSNGWGGVVDVRFPFHVHADTSDINGLWWEKDFNDKVRIQNAGLTYANHFGSEGRAWLFGEGGYLNEEWLGANLWGRYYGTDGRWWIGARLAGIRDRDPYSFGGLAKGRNKFYYGTVYDAENEDSWRGLAFAQAGYHFSGFDIDVQADYGKFADGDKGFKVSAVRHWDDTALGFWYTDTDVNAPGKSFTRAGIHMELPADKWFGTWFGNSSAHIWEQDTMILSTWDNESGREGGEIRTPERMIGQLRPVAMRKNVERLLHAYCSYEDEGENGKDDEASQEVRSLLEYITR